MPVKRKWRRKANTHHLFWPSSQYKTPLERKFRELDCMKVEIDLHAHELYNKLNAWPPKPTTEQMEFAIARHENETCSCFEAEQQLRRRRKRR